jgi:hypothetical protein
MNNKLTKLIFVASVLVGGVAALAASSKQWICDLSNISFCNSDQFLETSNVDQALSSAQTVFFGESDHYAAETTEFQKRMYETLIRNGFTMFGVEYGRAQIEMINRFIETGDEKWLEPSIGSRFHLASNIPGFQCPMNEVACAFLDNRRSVWMAVREFKLKYAPDQKLRFFGVDYDHVRPNMAFELIEEALNLPELGQLVQEIRDFSFVPGEGNDEEMLRISDKVQKRLLVEIQAAPQNPQVKEKLFVAYDWSDHLKSSLQFRIASKRSSHSAMLRRESYMQKMASASIYSHLDRKIAFSAHYVHLAKDARVLQTMTSKGEKFYYWTTFGSQIESELALKPVRIFMVNGSGSTLNSKNGAIESANPTNMAIPAQFRDQNHFMKIKSSDQAHSFHAGSGKPVIMNLSKQAEYVWWFPGLTMRGVGQQASNSH